MCVVVSTGNARKTDASTDRREFGHRSDLRGRFPAHASDFHKKFHGSRRSATKLVRRSVRQRSRYPSSATVGEQPFHGFRNGSGNDGLYRKVRIVSGREQNERSVAIVEHRLRRQSANPVRYSGQAVQGSGATFFHSRRIRERIRNIHFKSAYTFIFSYFIRP